MKKYVYTVIGLESDASAERILSIINSKIIGVNVTANVGDGTITLIIDEQLTTKFNAEAAIAHALKCEGFELITPPNTQKYSYRGDKPTNEKTVPLRLTVTLIAITAVISILFTYVFAAGILYKNTNKIIINQGEYNQPLDISDSLEQVQTLNEILAQIQYDYKDLTQDEVTEYLLKAYVAATGDRYAQYMNAAEYEQFISSNAGETVGVGITVTQSFTDIDGVTRELISIEEVYENSPAMKSGVKKGDLIYSIELDGKVHYVYDVGYSASLDLLLGEEGTVAKFSVWRPTGDGHENITFEITRAKFDSISVVYNVCSTNEKVGIVRITEFDLKTPKQFKIAVDELKSKGCEYFVFDLRGNPGGDLLSISATLSFFLSEGDVIISTEDSQGNTATDTVKAVTCTGNKADCSVKKEDIGRYKDLKFAVLTNGNTASAAELFTATVKDYNLGVVVGTKTYGKGCMQQILPLSSYGIPGALRVTTKMYFSMSKTVYHGTGIEPHEYIELSDEADKYSNYDRPHDVDNQLQKAISLIINK